MRSIALALAWALASSLPALAADSGEAKPGFRLFPSLEGAQLDPGLGGIVSHERLLRLPGDPDSLFTLGRPGESGKPKLLPAVEVNDVVLRLLPPDPRIQPSDAQGRPQGDYQPVDAFGRPYQLRLGARLVW